MAIRYLKYIFIVLALSLTANLASAAPFDEAIEAWLADDDNTALPALSTLANDGDVDAQVLLGVIAARPHSPYVAQLNRKERNSLLRAPGGLSGKSWLKVAAEAGDARAEALVAIQAPPFDMQALANLLKLGEDNQAAMVLARLASYRTALNPSATRTLSVPKDLLYSQGRALKSLGEDKAPITYQPHDKTSYANALLQAFALDAFLSREPRDFPQRDQMLRLFPGQFHDTEAEPAGELLKFLIPVSRPAKRLAQYCRAACPQALTTCMADAVALLGGYDQIWLLGSPLVSLISEERYLISPRFHADTARRMKDLMEHWAPSRQREWASKSCAAASRFRTHFP